MLVFQSFQIKNVCESERNGTEKFSFKNKMEGGKRMRDSGDMSELQSFLDLKNLVPLISLNNQ